MSEKPETCAQVEWKGKPLTVAIVDQAPEVGALFESWLERAAFAAAVRQRPTLRTEEYFRAALREAIQSSAAGEFAWGGPLAERARWAPAGLRELTFLAVVRHDPTWSRKQHEELLADPVAFGRVLKVACNVHKVPEPETTSG